MDMSSSITSGDGRTKVHKRTCVTRSSTGCDYPVRLSAESIRALASKIRSRFYELGTCGAWNASLGSGNPADSGLVRMIVLAVKEEQALAGVHMVSARRRALLPAKLAVLIHNLTSTCSTLFANTRLWYSIWDAVISSYISISYPPEDLYLYISYTPKAL